MDAITAMEQTKVATVKLREKAKEDAIDQIKLAVIQGQFKCNLKSDPEIRRYLEDLGYHVTIHSYTRGEIEISWDPSVLKTI